MSLREAKVGLVCRVITNPFNTKATREYWFVMVETINSTDLIPIANGSTVERLKRLGYPVVEATLEVGKGVPTNLGAPTV